VEALRLFNNQSESAAPPAAGNRPMPAHEPDETALHEAEMFLADRVERDGDLARIQVALALSDTAAGASRENLEGLVLDRGRFPRTVHAIERVLDLLKLPAADRPEGFWPRFLLEQLEETGRA
jgi:hypothetical protein